MMSLKPSRPSERPAAIASLRCAALLSWLVLCLVAGCGGGGDDTAGGSGTAGPTGGTSGGSTPASLPVATGAGATYVVGTGGTLPPGATRVAALTSIAWGTLPAGSVVLVSPGTYAGVTTITSVGTAANPVVVTAYDSTQPPLLTDSIDLQGAAWVQLSHLAIQAPTYAGFIIRLGSNHVTVSDSSVSQASAGVNITDAAGTGHRILRNVISDSVVDGINVEVNSDAAERTLIQYNTITRSGVHGIEVRASHYQVEYNVVSASGQTSGGASGIHLFSGSPSEDSGDDNWVRYNLSFANVDTLAYDGNGIEADQWCDGNTIAFNQVWGNDGAGIILYDASNSVVQNNTAWSNGVDSGGMMATRGEIVVSGTAAATVAGNHVWNNIGASTRATVSALYVDSRAVSGGNTIGANFLDNAAGGTVLRWTDSATKQTAASIDAVTGIAGNLVAAPAFANTSTPLSAGLRLAALPALAGLMPTGLVDFAGASPVSGDAFFGAYYTVP